ncbi:MAG: DUF58 domain-containing protein [Planctomycetes bacterium]|nr:DUF58 domain-containing protein [Planctomycetota bacterium]
MWAKAPGRIARVALAILARAPRATPAGRAFVVGTMSLATAAVLTGSAAAYALLSCALAVAVVSFLFPAFSVSRISVRMVLPRTIWAGRPYRVRVAVASKNRVLPAFGLRGEEADPSRSRRGSQAVFIPVLAPGRSVAAEYWCQPKSRGVYSSHGVVLSSSFPFGFGSRTVEYRTRTRYHVYPALGEVRADLPGLGEGSEERPLPGFGLGSAEFHGLRRFRPGDNPRHIHWKATAKRGEEIVREFARSWVEKRIVALDATVFGPRAGSFERGVSLAATICQRIARSGQPFALWIGSDPPVFHPCAGKNPASYLAPLAEVEPLRRECLGGLAALATAGATVFLVTTRAAREVRQALEKAGERRRMRFEILSTAARDLARWYRSPADCRETS